MPPLHLGAFEVGLTRQREKDQYTSEYTLGPSARRRFARVLHQTLTLLVGRFFQALLAHA
jgi:hypothetical protein